jgi:hypothetical protein
MWKLANYYMLKEPTGSPGTVYFDPNFCFDFLSQSSIPQYQEWKPAYEADVGQPISSPQLIAQGPAADCHDVSGNPVPVTYGIFSRDYTNAQILFRPNDDRHNCTDYTDATGVTITLSQPMRILRADGTLSGLITEVKIRNAEAVVLMQ